MGAGFSIAGAKGSVGVVALVVVGAGGLPGSSAFAATPAPCAPQQTVPLAARAEWRCEVEVSGDRAYLVRARQENLDVVVEIIGGTQPVVTVDAPARRAVSELALVGPKAAGKYLLAVRSIDRERAPGKVDVSIQALGATSGGPLLNGLRELTLSAAISTEATAQVANRRVARLKASVEHFRAAGARELEAEALLRIAGLYYWSMDDYSGSATVAAEAADEFSRLNDPVMQSQAAMLRGAALLEVANAMTQSRSRSGRSEQSPFTDAMKLLDSAVVQFHTAGRSYDEAHAINYLGIAYYYQGDFVDARARFAQAARLFRRLGANVSAALPLQNIAMIDYEAGDYARAIDGFASLLQVLSPEENAVQYSTVILNRATAEYALGRFDESLASYVAALRFCSEHHFKGEEARSLHGLGTIYQALGEQERATIFHERALRLRRTLADSDPRGLQTSLLRVGELKRKSGDLREALALHLEALDRALNMTQKALAFYAIGLDHEAANAFPAALQAYEAALKLDLPADWPVRVSVMAAEGRVRMRSGDPLGRTMILDAARLHERRGDQDLAAQEFVTLALEARRTNDVAGSLAYLRKALPIYESQRLRAINPDLRATYVASRVAAFELEGELYMALRENARDPAERQRLEHQALLATEANRLRLLDDFRELGRTSVTEPQTGDVRALDSELAAKRHRLAVIQEQSNPSAQAIETLRADINLLRTRLDLAQAKRASGSDDASELPTSLGAVQAALPRDAAVLAYQLGETRSWLWVVTRKSAVAHRLAGRDQIEEAARQLYQVWSDVAAPIDAELERSASRTILGSAAASLASARTIAVVADGILRNLPFGALRIDEGTSHLARLNDSHSISFRPSLTAAPAGAQRVVKAPAQARILLIGDPTTIDRKQATDEALVDPWAWQPLPNSRAEVESIAGIASDWQSYVLLGAEATKGALFSMPLDSFRAIHFATHARLDTQDPQLSSIALSSRDANFGALASILTVREILGFKLQAETVVLSACEASLGKEYRGQPSVGLSEAFLLAGAHNVLGTVWKVSDHGAHAYMRAFYEQYIQHDASPAEAARLASAALSKDPAFSHPFYWAAFVLTQQ